VKLSSSLRPAARITALTLDIFGTFDAGHYRPKERSDAVRVVHAKTREEAWVPLVDDAGAPLYPASSRCRNSQATSAAVASDGKPIA
jgi:hypothetical protein